MSKSKSVLSSLTVWGVVTVVLGIILEAVGIAESEATNVVESVGVILAFIGRLRASQPLHIRAPWSVGLMAVAMCIYGGSTVMAQQSPRPQPIRGVVRGALPHVMIVGVDGVRNELRGNARSSATPGQQTPGQQTSGLWRWSASGQAHHASVVQVWNPVDSSAGSGVYCEWNGFAGVLTCAHLNPRGTLRVTFSDGVTTNGDATIDRFKHDVAFVYVTHPTIRPVPIATHNVRAGDLVEFVTYGGPESKLRHFVGAVSSIGQRMEVATPVTHGDSGGPVFNLHGELVGIQSVGIGNTIATAQGFPVYQSSGAVTWTALTQFLQRCQAGQCSPQELQPGRLQFYPPDQQAVGPSAPAVPPDPPMIDRESIVAMVRQQLADEIREGKYPELRGPPGPQGAPALVDLDALAKKLPPVVLSIDGAERKAPLGQPLRLKNQQRQVR